MRWFGAIAVCAGALACGACLGATSHTCTSTDQTQSWLCPGNLDCAAPPTYCGTPGEIDACAGKQELDPCSYSDIPAGTCRGGVCEVCTPDLAGCTVASWTAMTSNTTANLSAVWAASSTDVFAAGDQVMMHYDGQTWAAQTFPALPTGNAITGLWGTSGHDVYTTAGGAVFHYDGTAWTQATPSPQPLHAITGAGDVITAVGAVGTLTQHAASQWTSMQMLAGVPATLYGVWSDAPTNIFVAGGAGVILRYDGTWTTSRSPSGPSLSAIWGSAGDDVYAVGDVGSSSATIYHRVGGSWMSESFGTPISLGGVWGISGKVFACGAGSILERAGGTWTSMPTPTTSSMLHAIAGSPPAGTPPATEMFAVGTNGLILRQTEPL